MDKLPNYARKKFLLVDDEFFMLGLIDRVLKDCGAGAILRASNGADALDLIGTDHNSVDCIIADLNMAPVNGLELLQNIRGGISTKVARDQRFVLLTGHGDSIAVRTAIALDVDGYILKPISAEKLTTAISLALSHSRTIKSADYYRGIELPDFANG